MSDEKEVPSKSIEKADYNDYSEWLRSRKYGELLRNSIKDSSIMKGLKTP